MNVIDLLKSDHETVNGLFKSFESAKKSDSEGEKDQIVESICRELDVHAAVEEEVFYPAVEKRAQEDEKAESSVKESYEEHALVKTLVAELKAGAARGDGEFDTKVKVLKDLVQHHVKEEEGTLMPRARRLLSGEELDELGTQAESRKQELLGRSSSQEPKQPRPRRSSSSRSSSSRGWSARSSSSGSSPSSSPSSRRRSSASVSSRSSRSAGPPRGSRRRSSSGKRRSR